MLDDTPMVIVSTCKVIAHHCNENKTPMTQEQKVSMVCAINALSCPCHAAYVNVVNAIRANDVMAYAKDKLQNSQISQGLLFVITNQIKSILSIEYIH